MSEKSNHSNLIFVTIVPFFMFARILSKCYIRGFNSISRQFYLFKLIDEFLFKYLSLTDGIIISLQLFVNIAF